MLGVAFPNSDAAGSRKPQESLGGWMLNRKFAGFLYAVSGLSQKTNPPVPQSSGYRWSMIMPAACVEMDLQSLQGLC